MYKRAFHGWMKHVDFILLDELSLFLVLVAAYAGPFALAFPSESNPMGLIALILEINLLLIIASDFLETVVHNSDWTEFKLTVRHCFYLLSFTFLAMLIRDGEFIYPPVTVFICFFLYLLLSFVSRILWRRFLFKQVRNKDTQKALLIVTYEKYALDILRPLKEYAFGSYTANGIVLIDRDAEGEWIEGVPVVANVSNAANYICKAWTDEILFFRSSHDEKTQSLIERCREMALTLHFYSPVQGIGENKQIIERIAGYEVLTANLNLMNPYDAFIKRGFDLLIGLIGSLIALLVMVIVGPMIKKASPGPLLFKQERIGQNGKKFKMYKIRSMYMDADEKKKELEQLNTHADGMLFKMDFDPRVIGNRILPDGTKKTGIGDFIRRTDLDELPQFFNVLRGDMSVVGTRPPTVDEWEKYQYHHRARMSIRPGVTGLWQVNKSKDKMPFDEVVKLDTEYITTWSIREDVKLIFLTIASIFRGMKK